jgi:hypothetical protein
MGHRGHYLVGKFSIKYKTTVMAAFFQAWSRKWMIGGEARL